MRAVLVLLLLAPAARAAVFPEPLGYAKPVGDRWVFVQLGDAEKEAVVKSADARRQFAELRAKYPATGLYPRDSTAPVWTVDGFAPIDNVFVSADGAHLVRVEGNGWVEQSFPSQGARIPPEAEAKQLDAPGLTFFGNGKMLAQYTVRDLVVDPRKLPHSIRYILWTAGSALNEKTGKFVQFTQDSQKNVFDFRTGERLDKVAGGLANPIAGRVLTGAFGASLLLALGWGWWAFGRQKSSNRHSSPVLPAP